MEQSSQKHLIAYTTIIIDDIRAGMNQPIRYPLKLSVDDKEKPGCHIIFAYDFNQAENFQESADKLNI